nr:uncharacterized protein LOC117222223 [Megalopta genalis]
MNKDTEKSSDIASNDVDSSINKLKSPLHNTKMPVIHRNILQNIRISESIAKGGKITEDTLENIMSQNLNTTAKPSMIVVNKNLSANNVNNEFHENSTKVPTVNSDNEKLHSKVEHRKQVKNSSYVMKKKKESINKVGNVENVQTTSNDIPKPQELHKVSDQYSNEKSLNESQREIDGTYETNENIFGRSKRIRKLTNFDDYVTSYKKEIKKKTSVNILSTTPETSTTVASNHNENISNSTTPVLTRKSLPLYSSNVSGHHTSIKNIGDYSKDEFSDSCRSTEILEDLKYRLKSPQRSNSEISMVSINTSIHENANLKLGYSKHSNDGSSILIDKNLSSESSSVTTPVRKRGRPRKTSLIQQIDNDSIAETFVHNKGHNEKSYNITSNNGLNDDSNAESNPLSSSPFRKRGRRSNSSKDKGKGKSHSALDNEYIPKLKGPISVEDSKPESSKAMDTSDTLKIECAKCHAIMLKKQWHSHSLLKHNDMCWIQGEEPLDFSDEKLCKKILNVTIKKRKGKLNCEKCGALKRSVNGFLSHVQFCGKSDEEKEALMMTCPICSAVMMPSSMEIHVRTHKQVEQKKKEVLQIFSSSKEKVKRKAAEKAASKISEFTELVKDAPAEKKIKLDSSALKNLIKPPEQKKHVPSVWKGKWRKELNSGKTLACHQLGCNFTTSSLEDMKTHYSTCNFVPQECYLCKICKSSTNTKEEMVTHITETHGGAIDDDDKYSDFEGESHINEKLSDMIMDKHHTQKLHWTEPFLPAIRWTMEFEQKNYELQLYHNYTPNTFTLLKNTDATKHLPQVEVSMRTRTEKTPENLSQSEISWKQWQRFEGGCDKGIPTFFVGGPIWALAWLPIPSPMYSKKPTQYLAVSTHPSMESEYAVGRAYSEANIIQIWNVGSLNHETDNERIPTLSYALAHTAGTVWCLEWCPSGCYQDESLNNYETKQEISHPLKRMGMLAAACSDGSVHIYSLPFPEELGFQKTEGNTWPIYQTEPVITLVVNIPMYDSNKQTWQCTKLSWSKEHKHNTIAAGFSNGYIALWDLTCDSPVSMQKRQNTYLINAFQHFFAHGNAISMIALVPYNEARFLASGSIDRMYKFWNLDDVSTPQSSTQKGIIVDGVWMTHWPCSVISFDDALGYKHTNSYIIPIRDMEFKLHPILPTNSPTYALSVSDYGNSIAHGTLAGEIVTIFLHQVICAKDNEKISQKKKKLSSHVKVVDLTKTGNESMEDKNPKDYNYMPHTYNVCKDRFGITFYDKLQDSERTVPSQSIQDKVTAVQIEQYPFMSVNRISWNPNAWSYLWLVAGYQNGIVRLLNFKYMASRELKTSLTQHAEQMLKKTVRVDEKNS